MAQKRMFDKRVVESDRFTDLPNSSKALYFMAGMSADDRGFFQPRRIQKMCGFTDDDFKILIAKEYFIPFESGVMVVTEWNKNNWLDKRRITETEYVDELKLLKLINDKYELNESCLADVKPMLRENSIEENRIEYKEDIYNTLQTFKTNLTPNDYELINEVIDDYTLDQFKEAIEKSKENGAKSIKYLLQVLKNPIKKKKVIKPKWLDEDIKAEPMDQGELEELENMYKEFKR